MYFAYSKLKINKLNTVHTYSLYLECWISLLTVRAIAATLGHCGPSSAVRFLDVHRSDAVTSANDLSAISMQCLQLGTLCLLLSSTVTLSLYLNLF